MIQHVFHLSVFITAIHYLYVNKSVVIECSFKFDLNFAYKNISKTFLRVKRKEIYILNKPLYFIRKSNI